MRQIDLEEALNYLYPQPLAFLTATGSDGRSNIMALGWMMQASFEPSILAVAVTPKNFTHQLIEQTQAFAVSLAGVGQDELINSVGTISGAGTDKLAELGVQTSLGSASRCPLVEGAAVHFECLVEKRVTVGDHSVFFGRIVAAWAPEPAVRKIDNFGSSRYAPAQPAG